MKQTIFFVLLLMATINASARTQPITNPRANDDIRFWAGQIVEHAEMASDFTDDPDLKKRGLEFAQEFKKFTKGSFDSEGQKDFQALCDKISQYQNDVRKQLQKNADKNAVQINLDLLEHMDKETAYAKKKALGKPLSKREELEFWGEEHQGEAHVMATLMNPHAPQLKQDAQSLEQKLKSKDSLAVVEQANKELDAIGKELEKDPSKTRVPAKLAEHEKRERARAAQTLKELAAK